jgi:hypothetical protein
MLALTGSAMAHPCGPPAAATFGLPAAATTGMPNGVENGADVPGNLNAANRASTFQASEASSHAGHNVTIVGVVTAIHVTASRTTYIDFGSPYPHQDFTATIFRQNAGRFSNVNDYYGKRVAVTGKISRFLFRGGPETIVSSPDQLKVLP